MKARQLAAKVLVRVWAEDAYAAPALSAELDRSELDGRDRGLATEITYGVLRAQKYLETRLEKFGKLKEGDLVLRAHLLVGAYQIEFLDRVPARAAVNDAVTLVTSTHDRRVGGFCNAVLRRLSEDTEGRKAREDAVFGSSPSWLRKRLVRDVGEENARALLVPGQEHQIFLRAVAEPDGEFASFLERCADPVASVPRAYRYTAGGDPRKNRWFQEGFFVVQELGAQVVAHALGARPGERVLDACAGRGQKTSLFAQQVGPTGAVVATDLHQHKTEELERAMTTLGFEVTTLPWDFTQRPPIELEAQFDRVLVDAPCTGVGTLGRRPEIARRLRSSDPARMGELQTKIALHAARCLKPEGVLVFATCSVLSEEAEEVVTHLTDSGLRLAPIEEQAVLLGTNLSAMVRLLPQVHGTDGYFIARLAK